MCVQMSAKTVAVCVCLHLQRITAHTHTHTLTRALNPLRPLKLLHYQKRSSQFIFGKICAHMLPHTQTQAKKQQKHKHTLHWRSQSCTQLPRQSLKCVGTASFHVASGVSVRLLASNHLLLLKFYFYLLAPAAAFVSCASSSRSLCSLCCEWVNSVNCERSQRRCMLHVAILQECWQQQWHAAAVATHTHTHKQVAAEMKARNQWSISRTDIASDYNQQSGGCVRVCALATTVMKAVSTGMRLLDVSPATVASFSLIACNTQSYKRAVATAHPPTTLLRNNATQLPCQRSPAFQFAAQARVFAARTQATVCCTYARANAYIATLRRFVVMVASHACIGV